MADPRQAQEIEKLVERLRAAARRSAHDENLRRAHFEEGDYGNASPEDMLEWRAAEALSSLSSRLEECEVALRELKAASASCEGEQEHFEEWAVRNRYDMEEHPLHYLFLNERTYAARQGWKAALAYISTLQPRDQGGDAP